MAGGITWLAWIKSRPIRSIAAAPRLIGTIVKNGKMLGSEVFAVKEYLMPAPSETSKD